MAPMTETSHKASLPKLLALDQNYDNFDERIKAALQLADVSLSRGPDSEGFKRHASGTRISRGRSEFVFRWILEKLKTPEGRQACRTSRLVWETLDQLINTIPSSSVARILNSSRFVVNLTAYMEEVVHSMQVNSNTKSNNATAIEVSSIDNIPSRKRKRGEGKLIKSNAAILPVLAEPFSAMLGISLFLHSLISLSRRETKSTDTTSRAQIASILRTTTIEAVQILDLWMQCLVFIFSHGSMPEVVCDRISVSHTAILDIWISRSREPDDESGASPRAFASKCLLSTVTLLSKLHSRTETRHSDPLKEVIIDSLEQLIAKHLFVPAHLSFDAVQATRVADQAQNALFEFLEPLRSTISKRLDQNEFVLLEPRPLLDALPILLDLAIRLSPNATPVQQSAEVPWLSTVFSALSNCAREPIPHNLVALTLTDTPKSPLTNMLNILYQRKINLSHEYLESILVGYSGLKGLRKEQYPLRLEIVASLLELNGSIFVKAKDGPEAGDQIVVSGGRNAHSKYVEALIASLSEFTWAGNADLESLNSENTSSKVVVWTKTASNAVEQILRPLLHAYAASRKLASFISLWFWEVRRHSNAIGSRLEVQQPWLSKRLLHAFRDHFEQDMTPARILELLIEFILPIKLLADESEQGASGDVKWVDIPAHAPASAAFVILEVLLYSIDREETLQQNPAAWNEFKRVILRYTTFDLEGFPAASRVWSLATRLHRLSYFVDGKQAFLEQQKVLLAPTNNTMQKATEIVKEPGNELASRCLKTIEAFQFLTTVQNTEAVSIEAIDTSLENDAIPYYLRRIIDVVTDGTSSDPAALPEVIQLKAAISTMNQFPSSFATIGTQLRRSLFHAMLCWSASENPRTFEVHDLSFTSLLGTSIGVVTNSGKEVLDDMLEVLISTITTKSQIHEKMRECEIALDALLLMLPSLFSRVRREMILDTVSSFQAASTSDSASPGEELVSLVPKACALSIRLFEFRNPTAHFCLDPKYLVALAKDYDHAQIILGHKPVDLLRSLDCLFQLILKQALIDATVERQNAFFSSLVQLLEKLMDECAHGERSQISLISRPATTLLVTRALIVTQDMQSEVNTSEIANALIGGLKNALTDAASEPQLDAKRWAIFHSVAELLQVHKSGSNSLSPALQLLEEELVTYALPAELTISGAKHVSGSTANDLIKIRARIDSEMYQVSGDVASLLRPELDPQENCLVLQTFEQRLDMAKPAEKVILAHRLIEGHTLGNLRMLHVLIESLSTDDRLVFENHDNILVELCRISASTEYIGHFAAATSCINMIVRTKPWLAGQHGIETLLKTLASHASSQARPLHSKHAGFIFQRLCQITTSVVLLHRRKLGGRMHLIVSLLQSLMTCLFNPHRYGSSQVSLPPWLSKERLGVEHVTVYTRVLTTLCSPTVSSTNRRYGANNDLVDEVKKAKEYAGQYVSYVLLHYCTLQLQASIPAEMREKLKPGLWSMMEVVDIEAMRGMNAGMGRDERVIWGSIYGEWMRFGRFKLT